MRCSRGGTCGKRMPITLSTLPLPPTEAVAMSAYSCQIDSEQRDQTERIPSRSCREFGRAAI